MCPQLLDTRSRRPPATASARSRCTAQAPAQQLPCWPQRFRSTCINMVVTCYDMLIALLYTSEELPATQAARTGMQQLKRQLSRFFVGLNNVAVPGAAVQVCRGVATL
jgi:hypothetical protein